MMWQARSAHFRGAGHYKAGGGYISAVILGDGTGGGLAGTETHEVYNIGTIFSMAVQEQHASIGGIFCHGCKILREGSRYIGWNPRTNYA